MLSTDDPLDDEALLRYSRHLLLDDLGIDAQRRWAAARVLVIGAGGLGCSATQFLAAAGIGRLTVADDDVVELSNLQRQVLHETASVGQPKAESAVCRLKALNPDIVLASLPVRLADAALTEAVTAVDLVLDCSDNFATRHAVNAACVAARVPLVSGAAVAFEGQLIVFDSRDAASPCYACLYPEAGPERDGPCATFGVFAPLVGLVGSLQAAEALKLLSGTLPADVGRLHRFDLRRNRFNTVSVPRDPDCPVCGR
jgi:adenylyltransferase/sulfurtransferase